MLCYQMRMLLDIENIGIAVGISLLSFIYNLRYALYHINFRLQAAISDILFTVT